MKDNGTVAAVSTPYGKGGIAVIRISGDRAFSVADGMFRAANGKKSAETESRRAVYGEIVCDGETVDTGVAVFYRAPASFTGEDTVEISCHGGILITQKVLGAAFRAGAEPAGPGEFTKRAFLNGKLGLSQAEAVIDLIDAESDEKIRLAGAQSRGVLSKFSEELYEELKALTAQTYVYIDFPDEDLSELDAKELRARLCALKERAGKLCGTYRSGKAISEGVEAAIVGKPNTGKSSVLNSLLGEERAIVTDVAGTTRDTVEEKAVAGKVLLRLCDTAGIRNGTKDEIEKLGIERSVKKAKEAELIIAVFDASKPLGDEDRDVISLLGESGEKTVLCLMNKSDLGIDKETERALRERFPVCVAYSAKSGEGTEELRETIERLFVDGEINYSETAVITNARQYAALRSAEEHIENAIEALDAGFTQDVACLDLEEAMSDVSELDGRGVTEELVDSIFHRFCVGK